MDDRSSVDVGTLADPRTFAASVEATGVVARIHALAAEGVVAADLATEEALARRTADSLRALILDGDGNALARAIDHAPSLAIARYLWRTLEAADTDPRAGATATLATTLFALPVVIVAAGDSMPRVVSGVIRERDRLVTLLREQRAFGACETFALAGTLATTEAIGLARLPALLASSKPDVAGADLALDGQGERVFLRFVAGALLAAPGIDPLTSTDTGTWGAPFAHALQRDIATPGAMLLALPLPPRRLASALRTGRVAQREVAAQLFVSNAIRKFRASVGEPTAIISAHRTADATGGGELRLSLSSPFDPREAEGLRVALYPFDAVGDVAAMLVDLVADCRVTDVRIEPGVHADLDPATGLRRLFKNVGSAVTPGSTH